MNDVLSFLVENADSLLTVAALLVSAVAVFLPDHPAVKAVRGLLDLVRAFVSRKPAELKPPVALEGEETQELPKDKPRAAPERLDRPRK